MAFGNKINNILKYSKQPEFRPVFYLLPFIIILLVVDFIYLSGIWLWVGVVAVALIFAILTTMGWKLSVANSELKLRNAQTESVISKLNVGIIAYDTDFKVSIFNPAAEEIFGVKEGEILNKNISASMAGDAKYKLLTQTVFTSLAPKVVELSDAGQYPHKYELSFNNPEVYLNVITDRIYDKNNRPVGFIKIVTDKTREVGLLNAKTDFIGVAAHQLRTPLTAINWSLELLSKSEGIGEEDKSNVSLAFGAAKKMLKTINNLLDVSKIEEGRFGYDFKKVDLTQFLDVILKQSMPVAKEYGIKLYFRRPEKNISVVIDEEKLSMAVVNLIENAIRYNVKNGSVTVSAEMSTTPGFAVVSVEDTGVGIPEEENKIIFEKFNRGKQASKIAPNGTGLGLYIVKNVVNRHGGEVWFESELNRGTIFYLTIPINENLIPKKDLLK